MTNLDRKHREKELFEFDLQIKCCVVYLKLFQPDEWHKILKIANEQTEPTDYIVIVYGLLRILHRGKFVLND